MKINLTSEEKQASELQHRTYSSIISENSATNGNYVKFNNNSHSFKPHLNKKLGTVNELFLTRFAKIWRDSSRRD